MDWVVTQDLLFMTLMTKTISKTSVRIYLLYKDIENEKDIINRSLGFNSKNRLTIGQHPGHLNIDHLFD